MVRNVLRNMLVSSAVSSFSCSHRTRSDYFALAAAAGFRACVYNRSIEKCDALKEKGALVVSSPKEVAENSGACVGSP